MSSLTDLKNATNMQQTGEPFIKVRDVLMAVRKAGRKVQRPAGHSRA